MMIFILSVIVLLVFSLPLLSALFKGGAGEWGQRPKLGKGVVFLASGILLIIVLNILLSLLTEYFWFANIGYNDRYWTVLQSQVILFLAGAIIVGTFLYLNYRVAHSQMGIRGYGYGLYIIMIVAFFFGFWPAGLWNEVLLFINQVRSPQQDPIFGRSISFYLFSLPLYSAFMGWLIAVLIAGFLVIAGVIALKYSQQQQNRVGLYLSDGIIGQFLFLTALFCLALAWFFYVRLFYLLYSKDTAVIGAGYTDTHATIYGYYATVGVFIITALLLVMATLVKGIRKSIFGITKRGVSGRIAIIPTVIILVIAVTLWLIPQLVQSLIVSPNEITLEKPYLEYNIDFTRQGYSIDEKRITEELYPIGRNITSSVIESNQSTLMNVRLWDWRALIENLRQQQEIRLYYRFNDVDIDRYLLNGEYRQVMLAIRELAQEDLDQRSKNWVNLRLKYTHGFGAVLVPVHDIKNGGKPNLLIRNIPPQTELGSISINQPRIYHGELTNSHIYVNTTEQEFDYPVQDNVVSNSYDGAGGVSIGNFWKKLLFALRFDDYRLLISGYFTNESKIMFRRNIRSRAQALLPFLLLDNDPYPVITDDGRIVWVLDSYTNSSMYPYSQQYQGRISHFQGHNYIRNSVKIVIDAYHGTIEPYVIDTSDVIISSYQRVFPGLFKNFGDMPEYLKRHIRYPVDYFSIQTEMYTAYHMVNPETFYQKEDLWQFATEKYREDFQIVSPYYVMIQFPEHESVEFALIVPFTPRNKNVMNAWMAGRSDVPNYGKLTVYPFPKGEQVFGPRQIEARIDQNPIMSQSISLWSQHGSEVIRGNMLVVPLFHNDSLFVLYVEPLYIQATDAKLPEVKRVIAGDQNQVVWAEEFDAAIELLEKRVEAIEELAAPDLPQVQIDVQRARALLREIRSLAAQGSFSEAGSRLEELTRLLEGSE